MLSIEQVSHVAPTLSSLCASIVLTLGFGLGIGMFAHYITPTFASISASFSRDGLAEIILPLLQTYLVKTTAILAQTLQHAAVSIIPLLPLTEVVIILQYLAPIIETHEILFALVEKLVGYLDSVDSIYYQPFNLVWEQMRDLGNELVEIYRGLEEACGITPEESRIPEQWFEN